MLLEKGEKTMPKYIDADKLQELCMKRRYPSIPIDVFKSQPSANVVEVKHGEWQEVKRWECSIHSVTDMKCSVCHHYASQVLPHQTTCTYDFCPFCGADMRGKTE